MLRRGGEMPVRTRSSRSVTEAKTLKQVIPKGTLNFYRLLMVKAVNERTPLSERSCIKQSRRLSPCKTECVFQGCVTPERIQHRRDAKSRQGNLSRTFKLHFQDVQNKGKRQCDSLAATKETGYWFLCVATWLFKGQLCFGSKGDEEKGETS